MKTKEKLQKKLNLDDFLSENLVETIDLDTQSKITGGMKWLANFPSPNFQDCRTSSGYWLNYKLSEH